MSTERLLRGLPRVPTTKEIPKRRLAIPIKQDGKVIYDANGRAICICMEDFDAALLVAMSEDAKRLEKRDKLLLQFTNEMARANDDDRTLWGIQSQAQDVLKAALAAGGEKI